LDIPDKLRPFDDFVAFQVGYCSTLALSPDGNADVTLPYTVDNNRFSFIIPDFYI